MKLDNWLNQVYQEEQEKNAQATLEELMAQLPLEEVIKLAQVSSPKKPEPVADESEKEKIASLKLAFVDKLARQLARTNSEVAKEASCKSKTSEYSMEKDDAFTSPEAQMKAKAMSRAMKASKGAPPKVRKAAIGMAGREVAKQAGAKRLTRILTSFSKNPASEGLRSAGAAAELKLKKRLKRGGGDLRGRVMAHASPEQRTALKSLD